MAPYLEERMRLESIVEMAAEPMACIEVESAQMRGK